MCAKVSVWKDQWRWYGVIECPECSRLIVEHVVCSTACEERYRKEHASSMRKHAPSQLAVVPTDGSGDGNGSR